MNTGRAVLFKSLADVAARASGLITFPVVAAYVGAEGYGAFQQVSTVVGVVIPLASLGIGSSMVRFFAARPWSRRLAREVLRVGAAVAALGLAFTALVFALAPLLNDAFLGYRDGDALFRWGALLVVLGAVEFWALDLLRARDWLMLYAATQLSQTLVLVAATVVLLVHGYGVIELMIATVIVKAVVVASAVAIAAVRGRRAGDALEDEEQPPTYSRMVRFGLPLTISGIGLWMVHLSDRLVVGGQLGAGAVGRYGIVYSLATLLVMGASGLYLPAYTRLMRSAAENDRAAVEADVHLFHRYLALATVPLAAWLAVIIKPAVVFLGGDEFQVSLLVVVPVVAALFLNQWNGLAHYVLIVNDRTPLQQNLWLATGALNVALCLLLVPAIGLEGAAIATLVCFVVMESIQFREALRHADLVHAYRFAATGRIAVAAAAAAAVAVALLTVLPSDSGFVLVGASLCFAAVFAAAAVLLGEVGRDDIAVVARAVRPGAQVAS